MAAILIRHVMVNKSWTNAAEISEYICLDTKKVYLYLVGKILRKNVWGHSGHFEKWHFSDSFERGNQFNAISDSTNI